MHTFLSQHFCPRLSEHVLINLHIAIQSHADATEHIIGKIYRHAETELIRLSLLAEQFRIGHVLFVFDFGKSKAVTRLLL